MNKKLRFAILKNERENDHLRWEEACQERADEIEWEVIDLTKSDWFEKITRRHFDGLLTRPPAYTNSFKNLYDERVGILNTICNIPVYPSLEEILIYENKKLCSYWLKANHIPHPKTDVFYYQKEALDFIAKTEFPLVGKTNIGASGSGVVILRDKISAKNYINNTFSGKGAMRSVGPKWKKKGFLKRVIKKLLHPKELQSKLFDYQQLKSDIQKDFILFQEFIPHTYEWRCVRIGDSYFAHKKIVVGEKASGSLIKGYENPPLQLLDFLKEVTDKRNFLSQSVDIFETAPGAYLVNEMQCIFGQSDPYQMLVDGQPGRYKLVNNEWIFEPGDFNRLQSYALRLDHFINMIYQNQLVFSK
ncbi:MAG: RimK family alpha-L-glutamate ligase [Saprospiraceae bacterium]